MNLSGLSAAFTGYADTDRTLQQTNLDKLKILNEQDSRAGADAYGRTLQMIGLGQGGAQAPQNPSQPMAPPPGQPSMPAQPQQDFMGPPAPLPQTGAPMPQPRPMGAPQGGMAPMPGRASQPASTGLPPQLGQFAGKLDWQTVVNYVAKANPGAPPRVIAAAVDKFQPLMTAQALQDWRSRSLAIQQQNADTSRGQLDERRRANDSPSEAGSPAAQAFRVWMNNNPDATPAEITEMVARLNGGGRASAAGSADTMAMSKFLAANPNASPAEIADYRQRLRASGKPAGGTGNSVDAPAMAKFLQENPNASAEEIAAFRNKMRATPGIVLREQQQQQKAAGVAGTIDSAIRDIENSQRGGPDVAGLMGRVQRGVEFAENVLGAGNDTTAADFESKIRTIQAQIPRLLAGTSRISAAERGQLDTIVRGLGSFTSPQAAASALQQIKEIITRNGLEKASASGGVAAPGGASAGASATKLKPMTPDVQSKYEQALQQGHSRADIEKHIRGLGYDPAR